MFEKELADKFKAIFKCKDVTYDEPGIKPDAAREQEVLFVEVENPKFTFKDGGVRAMVTGKAVMYGRNDALTFGYFAKGIAEAPASLTKDLFFKDMEGNARRFRDIVERGFSFTYFFNSQYDPAIGTITSVDINIEET